MPEKVKVGGVGGGGGRRSSVIISFKSGILIVQIFDQIIYLFRLLMVTVRRIL